MNILVDEQEQAQTEGQQEAAAAPVAEVTLADQVAASQAKVDGLKQAIANAVLAETDVTADAIALAAAMGSHRELVKKANAGELQQATAKLGADIMAAVGSTNLAELLQEAVHSVYWTLIPGDADNGPVMTCSVNVKARQVSAKKPAAGGAPSTGGGRVKLGTYSVDGAEATTAKEFVTTHAPESVRGNSLFSTGKWVTKPDFITATVKELEDSGHVVVHTAAE